MESSVLWLYERAWMTDFLPCLLALSYEFYEDCMIIKSWDERDYRHERRPFCYRMSATGVQTFW